MLGSKAVFRDMRLSLRIAAGLAVVALIATAWLKYYREGASQRAASAAAAAKSAESEQTNPRPLRSSQNPPVIGTSSLGLANAANSMSAANATNSPNPSADSAEWEGQIDNILADESNDDVRTQLDIAPVELEVGPVGRRDVVDEIVLQRQRRGVAEDGARSPEVTLRHGRNAPEH